LTERTIIAYKLS